ncbi:QueD-like 6-pyruvoyl-tetrahydropterin synthase [Mycobacterium phage CRB2]|uniref:QueD-like queosine biosynthesis n=1 Tax=Mycobacterium phage CRB2 TaxID=2483623 RepID=A0A455LS32_9CAUD|nr:QueD-like 6-pyruvoyl-tetrahydropterin synthase [Mycobacterium phage CRB2]AYP69990.1 QueD-like queosine biosynthesis [Mycobacterium phage CRB2]
MIELTVKHHFSAGHRIPGLPGEGAKCSNLHGHTFGVAWSFEVRSLDAGEMEFAEAKKALRAWVDDHFDHGYLVAPGDDGLVDYLQSQGHKFAYVEPVPTTEAIAAALLEAANDLRLGATCVRVHVTEGPHNEAVAIL